MIIQIQKLHQYHIQCHHQQQKFHSEIMKFYYQLYHQ